MEKTVDLKLTLEEALELKYLIRDDGIGDPAVGSNVEMLKVVYTKLEKGIAEAV